MGPLLLVLCLHLTTCVQAKLCTKPRCEYHFDVQWSRTMTYLHKPTDTVYNVEATNGKLMIASTSIGVADNDDPLIGTSVDPYDMITGDGNRRNIITINGRFPGPDIHVMEGAEIVVHAKNSLIVDALAIHWHGMHQRNSYWSDGISYVTQYPIPPGTSYTYTFKADPAGTHWYHSHVAYQRTDGLYGALIVQRRESKPPSPNIPIMVLSEMFRYDGRTIRLMQKGVPEMIQHKTHYGIPMHKVHSVLVNGRGRIDPDNEALPLSVLSIQPGTWQRFSVIHAGADYAYKVYIDDHPLWILAMDGYNIEPVEVDIFYIYPGESLDFAFKPGGAQSGSFWIHVEGSMLHETMPGHGSGGHEAMNTGTGTSHDTNAGMSHDTNTGMSHDTNAGTSHDSNTGTSHDTQSTGSSHDSPSSSHDTSAHHNVPHKRDVGHGHHGSGDDADDDEVLAAPDPGERIYDVGSDGLHEHTGSDDTENNMEDHHNQDDPSQTKENHNHGKSSTMHNGAPTPGQTMMHGTQGRAILWYEQQSLPVEMPEDREKFCSHCKAFNCPAGMVSDPSETCITINDLRGSMEYKHIWEKLKLNQDPDFRFVVNSIFSGKPGASGSSINGKKFVMPLAPLYESAAFEKDCSTCNGCGPYCTNVAHLPSDAVVELIFSNLQNKQEIYAHHPIHMHGHSFAVTKVVFPTFEDGKWKAAAGISCEDEYCDRVVYSDNHSRDTKHVDNDVSSTGSQSHHHRKRDLNHGPVTTPGLGQQPIFKDTILVPARGYVVVRILTDNPGTWFLHCHVTQHFDDGMAMLLNVPPRPAYPFKSQACTNVVKDAKKSVSGASDTEGADPGTSGAQEGSGSRVCTHWIRSLNFVCLLVYMVCIYRPFYIHT